MIQHTRTRSRAAYALVAAMLVAALPAIAAAQQPGTLTGRVASATSVAAVAGAQVTAGTQRTETDARGEFRLVLPAGTHAVTVAAPGHGTLTREVTIVAGRTTSIAVVLEVSAYALDELVVTTSREERRKAETPASVGVVSSEQIRAAHPTHPAELLNQVAGVWVSVTGGEGHMTSIRQPKTTSPVYLYLENGVPTRSTGFFNHNALYEVNVAQADRIEVVKGPMTALYGSDAIGGMINVLTRSPAEAPRIAGSVEAGGQGYQRLLLTGSAGDGTGGILAEANLTRTDGWRDGTGYDRASGTLTWERALGTGSLRTVASFSMIDQQTAGASSLSAEDFRNAPELNYTPISFREVRAFRASSAYQLTRNSWSLDATGFVRWNDMEMLPNWSLTYDPAVTRTGHSSAGALLRVRRDIAPLAGSMTFGLDAEYSPGEHREWSVQATRTDGVFTDYERGGVLYDYDVAFSAISPYVQLVSSPLSVLHLTAGLRFDRLAYDYDNPLGALQEGRHRRPASTEVSYTHLSPKVGATLELTPTLNVFAAYGHGFRAPSEGQLFRQGRAASTLALAPVKADNLEAGARARVLGVSLEAAVYRLIKSDDILSFTHPDGTTETVNAGETLHQGVELAAATTLADIVDLATSYTRATHRYEEWLPGNGVDYSGNTMEDAPRTLASASLGVRPPFLAGGGITLEWAHVGAFWMDPANTHRYDGHDLLHVRAQQPLLDRLSVFARVHNVTDERYAETAAYTDARGQEFAPGMPRTLYFGLEWKGGTR
ncbi:MAG TPA: TonB-dependent receptor [Longimicrobiales bacterium]|nr:TonB-dependent receptor [Longimicrobiales bacterium]